MKLNIVHKFTLLSAVATILITTGMALIVSHIVTTGMLRDEGEITAATLRAVTNVDLKPEDFVRSGPGPRLTPFTYIWRHLDEIRDVHAMWVYDAEGRTVWMDNAIAQSHEQEVAEHLQQALRGEPAVSFQEADDLYQYRSGLLPGQATLAIYIPLLTPDGSSVYGVIEVWKRPETFLARRARLLQLIWLAGGAGGVVLFLFLYGFFRRALREQTRLREVEKQFENVELELDVAGGIQRKLMPSSLPEVPGCSLAGWHEPAREVGGDYYDAFVSGDGSLVLVVADSEGKGMPGALMAARVRHYMRAEPEATAGAAGVVEGVDRMLREHPSRERRISILFARLDPASGDLRYCSAGRCAALMARDGTVSQLAADASPAGAGGGARTEHLLSLRAGDCLLCCTDGIVGLRNSAGDTFGTQRLMSLLKDRRPDATAQGVLESVRQAMEEFAGRTVPTDDRTALCLVMRGTTEDGDRTSEDGGGTGQ